MANSTANFGPLVPLTWPQTTEVKLANQLTLVAAPHGHWPLATVCLAFPAGSARDPAGKAGLADFAVELLRRGTKRRSASAINEALELMGADLRTEIAPDTTYVSITVPAEHLQPTLRLLAELVQTPAFAACEVRQARQRTLALLATDLDDPSALAANALCRVALGKHPYAHPGRGLTSAVETFTRTDCVSWWKQWLVPQDAVLTVVGDISSEQAIAWVQELFEDWQRSADRHPPLPPVPAISGNRILLVNRPELTQAQIRLASNGPHRRHAQLVAARLSSLIFGGGFSSRLVDSIRVNRGLSYGVASFLSEEDVGGLFCVSSYTKNESVGELMQVVFDEVDAYRRQGPGLEELQRAQRYINGLFPLSLQTVDQVARALVDMKRFQRPSDWLSGYRERVQEVTVEQAGALANQFFLSPGWVAAVVGRADALSKQLKQLGKVQVMAPEDLM